MIHARCACLIAASLLLCSRVAAEGLPIGVEFDFSDTHLFTPEQKEVVKGEVCKKMAELCNKQFCRVWKFDPASKEMPRLKLTLKNGQPSGLDLCMEVQARLKRQDGPQKWRLQLLGPGEFIPNSVQLRENLRDEHVVRILEENQVELERDLVARVPVAKGSGMSIINLLVTFLLEPSVVRVARDQVFRIEGKCGDGSQVFVRLFQEKQEEKDENGKKMPVVTARCAKFERGRDLDDISNHLTCMNGFQVESIYLMQPTFETGDSDTTAALAPPP